jgi:SAM-dependent methyltransferase
MDPFAPAAGVDKAAWLPSVLWGTAVCIFGSDPELKPPQRARTILNRRLRPIVRFGNVHFQTSYPARVSCPVTLKSMTQLTCSVCGGQSFIEKPVLWDKLATQWQLSDNERGYIDRQQGKSCLACGANLRSIALADAIRRAVGTSFTLQRFISNEPPAALSMLEINEAGSLSPFLRQLKGHVLAVYPDVDMHAMPYAEGQFDMVVHSDTLEHVAQPIGALTECRRVLKAGGWLCFTVPTIVGRLTRGRAGLERSFHGHSDITSDDFLVHTEFGADMWTTVLQAGFTSVVINAVEFPAALAMSAQKL